ncbi:MAG: class II fructose-bisphosphate aldolase [Gammaproteobacteria bacterium]|nr:class II fructose-bisphosphate aldolase [Gammaproteobacteria bacterium]
MRENLQTVLRAHPQGAVGSFNILDLDMAFSVIDTAESLGLPAIIGIASRHFNTINAARLIPSIVDAMERAKVPLALHLDHAAPDQYAMIRHALDLGFSSIMIDGSMLPFAENVDITFRVVNTAEAYGAGVEGEIGGIAGEEGVADTHGAALEALPYTNAEEAKKFVEMTGVHALAIAVGTAHGIYAASPQISFDTIQACQCVGVPLVMHGATGVNDTDMATAVSSGIRKINFFSGLLKNAMDTVRANSLNVDNDYLLFKQKLNIVWSETISQQMRLYANAQQNNRIVALG